METGLNVFRSCTGLFNPKEEDLCCSSEGPRVADPKPAGYHSTELDPAKRHLWTPAAAATHKSCARPADSTGNACVPPLFTLPHSQHGVHQGMPPGQCWPWRSQRIWWKVEIGCPMLAQPSLRFVKVPIIFGSRPGRPKGITRRCSTQLYFATVVCLFPESLVILCHARCEYAETQAQDLKPNKAALTPAQCEQQVRTNMYVGAYNPGLMVERTRADMVRI
ncbi:hypothetical protein PCH_Pc03g00290 [Penicillium rubens Wisconsin 54-1255]|uniref:Uncharacterized protein n=1 Tax=Penicillium rubens (strain ATCC 28089 / DSM 1075 / NRRL 1951 / Wisconsin 54-1255) TaxID=500485 RepID=B6GVS5_PENRW|nr:hypothetical protein PCH_Pc03g00290 [Penicillium rubens Wisconsin 54-1255]